MNYNSVGSVRASQAGCILDWGASTLGN